MHRIIREDIESIAERIGDKSELLSGKTVLITGGAGFLGRYIVHSLLEMNKNLKEPCKVIVLDNYITGLKHDFNGQAEVTKHDVTEPYETGEDIHFVLHAAGIASPVFYKKHKMETVKVGTQGTINMLELAREKKAKSFVLFSSSEVYGDPDPEFIPTPEHYHGRVDCTGARACYDEAKRISETLAMIYHEDHDLPVKIIRPFNVFGPGMRLDDCRVIPNFVNACLTGQKIPVYGSGKHTRTFCYVSDAITGILQLLLSDKNGEAFNLGNSGPEMSMKELAQMTAGMFKDAEVAHVQPANDAYEKADPTRRMPNIDKIKKHVGYETKVDIETGLSRFVEWAKDEIKSTNPKVCKP
jgi:UDP-glucuronate decarboxylase